MRPVPAVGSRLKAQGSRLQRAQAAIEMVVATIVALFLLLGALSLMVWFARTMIERQVAFERERMRASQPETQPNLDYYRPGRIFQ